MFDVGFTELLLLTIIGMVVIGPERLPQVARTVGRGIGQAKRAMYSFQRQLEKEVGLDDIERPVRGLADPDAPPSDEVEPPLYPKEAVKPASTKASVSDKQA